MVALVIAFIAIASMWFTVARVTKNPGFYVPCVIAVLIALVFALVPAL